MIKKFKWLDLPSSGLKCVYCGKNAVYEACDSHADSFPKLTSKNLIRIPNCGLCNIECSECGKNFKPELYLKKPKKELPTVIKQPKKVPKVKYSLKDKLSKVDLSDMRELSIFKKTTTNVLDILFSYDIGTQLAISQIENKIEAAGLEFDTSQIRRTGDKISKLLFTLLMIRSAGLSSYEKTIMEAEIERLYGHGQKNEDLLNLLLKLKERK